MASNSPGWLYDYSTKERMWPCSYELRECWDRNQPCEYITIPYCGYVRKVYVVDSDVTIDTKVSNVNSWILNVLRNKDAESGSASEQAKDG